MAIWNTDPAKIDFVLFNSYDLSRDVFEPGVGTSPPIAQHGDSIFLAFYLDVGDPEAISGLNVVRRDETQAHAIQDDAGQRAAAPLLFHVIDDVLYYVADHSEFGRELWRSDGTPEGTYVAADIAPQGLSSHPSQLVQLGETLIFRADDHARGGELWQIDLNVPKVEFDSSAYAVSEDGSPIGDEIRVRRTGSLDMPLEFRVDYLPGTANDLSSAMPDFVANARQYQFLPGQSEVTILPPALVQDFVVERDESLRMQLTVDAPAVTTLDSQSSLRIVDDDRLIADIDLDGQVTPRRPRSIGFEWSRFKVSLFSPRLMTSIPMGCSTFWTYKHGSKQRDQFLARLGSRCAWAMQTWTGTSMLRIGSYHSIRIIARRLHGA